MIENNNIYQDDQDEEAKKETRFLIKLVFFWPLTILVYGMTMVLFTYIFVVLYELLIPFVDKELYVRGIEITDINYLIIISLIVSFIFMQIFMLTFRVVWRVGYWINDIVVTAGSKYILGLVSAIDIDDYESNKEQMEKTINFLGILGVGISIMLSPILVFLSLFSIMLDTNSVLYFMMPLLLIFVFSGIFLFFPKGISNTLIHNIKQLKEKEIGSKISLFEETKKDSSKGTVTIGNASPIVKPE